MLNNEVKEILQAQFSKEENYKKIIKNVNREQKTYNKIIKIALLPTCAALLATIIIPNMCNKSIDFAKTNISGNNTVIEQDNQIQVSKEKIYKTMSSTGAANLAIGICVLVGGIVSGILLIVNGARLLKHKGKIMF